jgi:hypothetical protein
MGFAGGASALKTAAESRKEIVSADEARTDLSRADQAVIGLALLIRMSVILITGPSHLWCENSISDGAISQMPTS